MAGATGSAAGAAEADIPGRGGGWGAWVGNTLFFGSVAATAYFGYYTYRYSSDQLDTMVQETQKAENAFPGSQVGSVHGLTHRKGLPPVRQRMCRSSLHAPDITALAMQKANPQCADAA
jgi:hypothetical protein